MKRPTCNVKGCDEPADRLGKCRTHYRERAASWSKKKPTCAEKGCKAEAKYMGRCLDHQKARKPMNPVRTSPAHRDSPAKSQRFAPKPTKARVQRNKRMVQVMLELGQRLMDAGENYCWETGQYLELVYFDEKRGKMVPRVECFAHIVGRGECGGNEEIVCDPDNLAIMAPEAHTKMDHGGTGSGQKWSAMKCRHRLLAARSTIVNRMG